MIGHVLLVLTVLLSNGESERNCFPCTCTYTAWRLRDYVLTGDCSNLNLSYIPTIDELIYILDVSNNRLSEDALLHLSKFKNLKVLRLRSNLLTGLPMNFSSEVSLINEIDMSGNKLDHFYPSSLATLRYLDEIRGLEAKHFDDNAFKGFETLRVLDVTFSQITIPENIFSGLRLHTLALKIIYSENFPPNLLSFGKKHLSTLSILAPKVKFISGVIFHGLSLLENLDLTFCELQSLPVRLFADPSSEEMPRHLLSLSIEGVKSLPRDIFQGQQRLERLTMNGVEDIPSGIFDRINTLHHLNMSHSNVKRISSFWFSDLRSLKSLNLSYTGLQRLDNHSFIGLNSLSTLDLSHNQLKDLPASVLQPFKGTLLYLNAKYNNISYVTDKTFRGMFSLQALDLSFNGILKISSRSLSDLSKLQSLNLQNNRLYFIPEDLLQYNQDFQNLDISNNKLVLLPERLLENARSLHFLDISNNFISTFPEDFLKNSRFLELLVLDGNPLHCDCKLFSIRYQTSGSMLKMTGICNSPDYLKGMAVNEASSKEDCSQDNNTVPISSFHTQQYISTKSLLSTTYRRQTTTKDDVFLTTFQTQPSPTDPAVATNDTRELTSAYDKRPPSTKNNVFPITSETQPPPTDSAVSTTLDTELTSTYDKRLSTTKDDVFLTTSQTPPDTPVVPIASTTDTQALISSDLGISSTLDTQLGTQTNNMIRTTSMYYMSSSGPTKSIKPSSSSFELLAETTNINLATIVQKTSTPKQEKTSSFSYFTNSVTKSLKPVVFEGKDFDSVTSSGMQAFYVTVGVIGALLVFGVFAYVVRHRKLAIRSRSYTVNSKRTQKRTLPEQAIDV